MLSPFEVLPYSIGAICCHIQYITQTPLPKILDKRQIRFLDHYLRNVVKNPKKIGVVIENSYVDQHYLNDYSKYIVRCFHHYPRNCTRIHFFQSCGSTINADKLAKIILNKNEKIERLLNQKYLGHIVIRPIPDTFLGKILLKPYPHLKNKFEYHRVISREYRVSLFGYEFKLQSAAFQEQDRILAACATSSLWSFFHIHKHLPNEAKPSAIDITQAAYVGNIGLDRALPNHGLDSHGIARSIQAMGLEPETFDVAREGLEKENESTSKLDNEGWNLFRELVYAYVGGNIPVLLGTRVFNGEKALGLHSTTILGYKLNEKYVKEQEKGLRLRSHRLAQLYVHDDRTGPYTKIILRDYTAYLNVKHVLEGSTQKNPIDDIYKPVTVSLGLYHKIRVSYQTIKDTCTSVWNALSLSIDNDKLENSFKEILQDHISKFEWDIRLQNVNVVKNELSKELSLAKNIEKDELNKIILPVLVRNLPRFIWVVHTRIDSKKQFTLLFDATEIPQGFAFLDFVTYNVYSEKIMRGLAEHWQSNRKFSESDALKPMDYLWGMIVHFNRKMTFAQTLDGRYGKLKIPLRIKPGEYKNGEIKTQNVSILSKNEKQYLNASFKYIWVITEYGDLILAEEPEGSQEHGHPTLTQGQPARVGGELFCPDTNKANCWEVNTRSGRYSYSYTKCERDEYLENAIKEKFSLYYPENEFSHK